MVKETIKCSCCRNEKVTDNFYASQSYIHKGTGKLSVCKDCMWEYVITAEDNGYSIEKMRDILQMTDKPLVNPLLEASEAEAQRDEKNVFKVYMKNLGLKQNRHLRWKDGDDGLSEIKLNRNETKFDNVIEPKTIIPSENDNKNKEDVLKMLGYDPFESENESDKRHLFNKLVDFLDEGTLEDSFKLPAVIEIVKSFNQIDKINLAIARLTSNPDSLAQNIGSMKSLMEAKDKVLKSVLALAKDNGISVNHNNNKSKGGNTLNGIVKKLNEIGLSSAEINLFDLETCEAMKQIADFSNRSILEQLMLDENDYTDMLIQQKEMIRELDSKLMKAEEDNRLLKLEINKIKNELK